MKLKEKIFHVTDAEGNLIDLSEEKEIAVIINGKDSGLKIQEVFRTVVLDEEEGEIYGTSLLSYFTPQENGSLIEPEGNTVSFLVKREGSTIPLKVTEITRPSLYDDVDISFEYIKAFAELIGITKADELFAELLNDAEKEVFASERNKREADAETKKKADADAETKRKANEDAETKRLADIEAKKQADTDARAKVDPDYLVEEPKYKQHQKFYGDLGFKEYTGDNVHFFYSNKWQEYKEDPFVLVKRGDNWWEDVEVDVDNITEDEKTVQLEYADGEVRKKLTLDLESGKVSVSDAEKK